MTDAGRRKPGLTQAAGRTHAAIAILEPQLADHEKTLGAEHPNTLASRYNLANAYQDAGRTQEAIELFEPLLADLERVLGAEHPNTLLVSNNLAIACRDSGRIQDAIASFEASPAIANGSSATSIPTRSPPAATSPARTRPPAARRTRSRSSSRCWPTSSGSSARGT